MPKRTIYSINICVILIGLCNSLIAQKAVSRITESTVNRYAGVTAITGSTVTLDASVSSGFVRATDTVLLVQMTGISQNGNNINNAGKYEFHIVTGVNGQNVTLKSAITPGIFDPSTEFVQMVRVPSYKNAVIENTLTCDPWNSETGTGGILALMVDETLTFNADIDVSGRGFKGGSAYDTPYPDDGPCSFDDIDNTNNPDYPDSYLFAGYKGEGSVTKVYFDSNDPGSNLKGYGRTWNGGGGGNGKWSGGGGGANGGNGGIGDDQPCGADGSLKISDIGYVTHGNDGFAIKYDDIIRSESTLKRVFMGGGGGAGTGTGTDGGSGGGIVIIVAQRLHFSTNTAIKANGASVTETALKAGAGGGGSGGSILLSAKDYGNLKVEIMGGNGGSVTREAADCNDDSDTRGAGGGGGGGLLLTSETLTNSWYNNAENFKRNGGDRGEIISSRICDHISTPGDPGIFLNDFQIQLRGFLHNFIVTPDTTVCNGVPTPIKASEPKSGTDPFQYEWQSSSDENDWAVIASANTPDLTHSFTEDILYVRRVVTSGEVVDTSLYIQVNAYKTIINDIAPKDTALCWKESFVIRENATIEGGGNDNENYNIRWQVFDGLTWSYITNATENNLTASLPKTNDIRTYRFRREVASSKGCESFVETSDVVIQPVISGNTITPANQRVCEDTAELLTGSALEGGNGEYHYQWQIMSNAHVGWTDISNADNPNFTPGLITPWPDEPGLFQDLNYRRYITSGVCESLSNEVTVRFDRQSSPSHITVNNKTGDDALQFLFSEKLYADAPETGSGLWTSINNELSFVPPGEPTTTVNNLQLGKNTILWTVSNGACISPSDSVIIEVKDVVIPTGFSPNGDKINDCFRVVGAENAISSEIIIHDRYNKVVFESKSFKGSANLNDCSGWWDGCNMSGNELPSGTYSYQFTLNGDKVYKGYVVLKRQ